MEPRGPWVSASDLAEYAYCPRSYWYSRHPESYPGESRPDPRARAGASFHRRVLSAERRREDHAAGYAALLLAGVAIVVVAAFLGGYL